MSYYLHVDTCVILEAGMIAGKHQDSLSPDWSNSILHTNSLTYTKACLCLGVGRVNLSMTSWLVSNQKV